MLYRNNEDLLKHLEETKNPYIFSSDGLGILLEATTSVRTKIAIIQMLGPRLIDPKAKPQYFTGLFRYVEEKSIVEEVFKTRAQVLATSSYSRRDGIQSFITAGAGRGGGGPSMGIANGGGGGRGNPLLMSGRGGGAGKSVVGIAGATAANIPKPVTAADRHSIPKRLPNNPHHTRPVFTRMESEDSLDGGLQPTVFGFDDVLNALERDDAQNNNNGSSSGPTRSLSSRRISRGASTSLETIQENRKGRNRNEEEEEEDDEEDDLNGEIIETTTDLSNQLKEGGGRGGEVVTAPVEIDEEDIFPRNPVLNREPDSDDEYSLSEDGRSRRSSLV
jgi:hypothetical protein